MVRLRLGGRGVGADGETLAWSVAEGARGGRWREVASRDGAVQRSVLLEVAPTGRPIRLEMATTAGLLTLHPEPDESALHGNVVTSGGIHHVALPWSAAHHLLVASSLIVAAAVMRGFDRPLVVGEGAQIDVVHVDDALAPTSEAWILTSIDLGAWWLAPTAAPERRIELRLDATGLPILRAAEVWPLERDHG